VKDLETGLRIVIVVVMVLMKYMTKDLIRDILVQNVQVVLKSCLRYQIYN
jgi:hypothetical protein